MILSPTEYLLYSPLLPEVATGVLDFRDIAVPLRQALPGVRQIHGHVTAVDTNQHTVHVSPRDAGPENSSVGPAGTRWLGRRRVCATAVLMISSAVKICVAGRGSV
ncbi:MAG: hypothetical protein ACR2KJ_17730 [Jatrophihabitans sp.]